MLDISYNILHNISYSIYQWYLKIICWCVAMTWWHWWFPSMTQSLKPRDISSSASSRTKTSQTTITQCSTQTAREMSNSNNKRGMLSIIVETTSDVSQAKLEPSKDIQCISYDLIKRMVFRCILHTLPHLHPASEASPSDSLRSNFACSPWTMRQLAT